MDPESQRALIVVLVGGTLVMAIAAGGLYLVFRTYGSEKAGGTSHKTLIAAVLSFILLCCLGLMWLAYR
ncbi:MAG TPA: hypothetical protein VEK79_09105 [Thermoanaerobaculia bacterium]|nr:hypothetical protein [Thermoanaerobaculia bacterium]